MSAEMPFGPVTVQERFRGYFNRPQQSTVALQSPLPPEPLYSAPLNYWSIAKKGILDVAALFAVYRIALFIARFRALKVASVPLLFRVSLPNACMLLGLYRIAQVVVGLFVHPAVIAQFFRFDLEGYREEFGHSVVKRVSAQSEMGHRIDGLFVKTDGVEVNGRCILISPGNLMFYEDEYKAFGNYVILDKSEGIKMFKSLATALKANILFYNYAGVGRSTGWFPNRDAMAASHKAMRGLLEELGCKQICDFGWSIGGGVKWQSHAEAPPENPNKYVSIDYQTFRSVANIGYHLFGHFGSWGVSLLQWNYDNERAINQSQCKCIPIDCTGDEVMNEGNRPSEIEKTKENAIVVQGGGHGSPLAKGTISAIAKKVNAHFSN